MTFPRVSSDSDLIKLIDEIGFLPLLDSPIKGFNAEEIVDEDCRYVTFDEGGWDWPLWKWKGTVIGEMGCFYGRFFCRKAGFISKEWWPDFCNWRRSIYPSPEDGTMEKAILDTLRGEGSMITRDLRELCGFSGKGMRHKFDAYVVKLEMGGYIVTEDFVYPRDRHGREYGWGRSLLTTPELLYGKEVCSSELTPRESLEKMTEHLQRLFPEAGQKDLARLLQ